MKVHGKHLSKKATQRTRLNMGYSREVVYPQEVFDPTPHDRGYYRAIPRPAPFSLQTFITNVLAMTMFWRKTSRISTHPKEV